MLSFPFNDIKIKKFIKMRLKNIVMVKSLVWEWKRKRYSTISFRDELHYRNKKDFVDTLGHEMVHLYQMINVGDTGNHNKLFYSF